ncbi:MAG: 6-carboxytetrahydropterin synthase [Planctomycetota bacterium]|jgi:6-pyruvoyltetrahydropterin/6-carboxytetrahydropterin synthase|nr:6-carboxytetrahydropterin synthase [Planctomycetota bacterium]
MERWSIHLQKETFKFSAAHFLIFPDGTAERLHGHNYRVFVTIEAALDEFGLVLDFKSVKPVIRAIVDELDEHWLLPGEHPVLKTETRADGVVEIRYLERYYASPADDVIIMPMNNVSAENLSTWLGRELRGRLIKSFPHLRIQHMTVAVEETSGQRGEYHYQDEPQQT